MLKKKKKLTCC